MLIGAVPILLIDLLLLGAFVLIGIILARAPVTNDAGTTASDLTIRRREAYLRDSLLARMLDPWVRVLSGLVPLIGLRHHASVVAQHLLAAGNPRGYRGTEYVAYGLLCAFLGGATIFGLFLAAGDLAIWLPLIVTLTIYYVIYSNATTAARMRKVQINRQVPYFLDLATLTMAAGATFTQACHSIADGPLRGPLEEEIAVMLQEMQAGTPLSQALANMGERTESEELDAVIRAVRQGDKLGTPLTEVFRIQADMNRFRRSQRAEQEAGKLPNRLSIPNTIMIFASLLILFGPMIVKMARGEGM